MTFKFALSDCRLCKKTYCKTTKKERCCDKCKPLYAVFKRKAMREANKLGISDITDLIDQYYAEYLAKVNQQLN